MRNRHKTLLRDYSVPEVTLKACPKHAQSQPYLRPSPFEDLKDLPVPACLLKNWNFDYMEHFVLVSALSSMNLEPSHISKNKSMTNVIYITCFSSLSPCFHYLLFGLLTPCWVHHHQILFVCQLKIYPTMK